MISERGLAIIREFEGLRLKAYPDPASGGDPWTIAFGHTHDVEPGDTCTREQAEQWLLEDAADAEAVIAAHVKVPLSQGQLDALISFVFNVGPGVEGKKDGFVRLKDGRPSTMLRKLNAGDYVGAWQEFPRWNKAAGKVMTGLSRRRAAEAKLFAQSTEKPIDGVSEKPTQLPTPEHMSETRVQMLQEQPMPAPLIPILAAVLPSLIRSIPDFGKLFSSGSEVSERNVKAVEMAVGIVQEAVGARNAQEAAEIVASDPAQAQAAREAIQANWHELDQMREASLESARALYVTRDRIVIGNMVFHEVLALVFVVFTCFGMVAAFIWGNLDQATKNLIVTAALIGGFLGIKEFFFGGSRGSDTKTEMMARR
jgi:lysozyme